tara:strand:- start:872 stop:1360 length:489 start_codon:yes stop_codon:yes gene_type:complete
MTTVTSPIIYNIQHLTINFTVPPSTAQETSCVDESARDEATLLMEKKVEALNSESEKEFDCSTYCWQALGKITALFTLLVSAGAGTCLAIGATMSDMTKVELGIAIGVLGYKISKVFMEAEITSFKDYVKTWYDSYESILNLSLKLFPVMTFTHAFFKPAQA